MVQVTLLRKTLASSASAFFFSQISFIPLVTNNGNSINNGISKLCISACIFVVDTHFPTDPLFRRHLVACTPTDDAPLNWASDDSETEQLISAAENLFSLHAPANYRPRLNETNSSEVQRNDEPRLSEGGLEEPRASKLPIAESGCGDSASSQSTKDSNAPVVPLSFRDLESQEFNGGTVYKVSPQALESLLRHLSEPATSAGSSGEPEKLRHQASAPANLQSAAITKGRTDDVATTSEVPAERRVSVVASQQQAATSGNPKSSAVSNRVQDVPELPSTDSLLASKAQRQLAVGTTGFTSHPTPTNPNHGSREAISSIASNFGLPSESVFQPPHWSEVAQQPPAEFQGARPKVPPTAASETSTIPLFVELETLSEDEEEDMKCDDSASAVTATQSQSTLRVIGNDGTGSVDNIMWKFPALMIPGNSAGDQPMVSDVGLLAELDLRNNEELVGICIICYYYTILQPLHWRACISWQWQLRTGGFYWSKVLLLACPC